MDKNIFKTEIKSLIEKNGCPFGSVRLKKIPPVDLFTINKIYKSNCVVDLNKIVGTWHSGYVGCTWSSIIEYGNKVNGDLIYLADNPNHYISGALSYVDLYQIGGKYYIKADGNNTVVIAKYFYHFNSDILRNAELKGVSVTECEVDIELFWAFRFMSKFVSIYAKNDFLLTLKGDSYSNLKFCLENKLVDEKHELDKLQFQRLVDSLRCRNLRNRFVRRRYFKNIGRSKIVWSLANLHMVIFAKIRSLRLNKLIRINGVRLH